MLKNNLYRIIDANINRASEGIRVLEEYARFIKENKSISEKLKNIRHKINSLISIFPNAVFSRESTYDVGREIKNLNERKSIRDIIGANCKRFEEALRVLKEYGQLIGEFEDWRIRELEDIRFEIYTIEKELLINEKILRLSNATLYLVASRDVSLQHLTNVQFLNIIEKSIEGGIDFIQLREKNVSEKEIIELGKEIKKLTKNTEVLFIVNDRTDLALACDADGVHLGQDDMPVSLARKITPDGFIIGLSTHSIEQCQKALSQNIDYIGIGPVFQTPTKPDYKPVGLNYISWASENIKEIPSFAIGGIDQTNIDKVIAAGAKRVAVVRAIMNARDPMKITQQLKERLQNNNSKTFNERAQRTYAEI